MTDAASRWRACSTASTPPRDAGLAPIKLNAVVQRGVNERRRRADLARHFRGTGHIVRFIEYMDVGNATAGAPTTSSPRREIVARWIALACRSSPLAPDYAGEVAERYRYPTAAARSASSPP